MSKEYKDILSNTFNISLKLILKYIRNELGRILDLGAENREFRKL